MATVQTIIDDALDNIIGGEGNHSGPQRAKALGVFNNMLSSWSAEKLIIPYATIDELTLVVGQEEYTIGSGGDFDTTRPLRVIDAFIRDSSNIDHKVDVLMTRQAYDDISNKGADSRPTRLYFDPQWTLGKIWFDFQPETEETLHLISDKPIGETTLAATLALPDFYKEPLVYNLSIRLAPKFAAELTADVVAIATQSKITLMNLNAKDKLYNKVRMDVAMTWNLRGRSRWMVR